jgi:hypothetical protein
MSVAVVSQISDGQIQAPVLPAELPAVASAAPKPAAAPMADHAGMAGMSGMRMFKRQTPGGAQLVTCKTPGTLQISLADGVLKDDKGRTGYIASNYQFQ